MIAVFALALLVQSAFGGNLVEVLRNDGETTLIALVQQAGLADALLGGMLTEVDFLSKENVHSIFCNLIPMSKNNVTNLPLARNCLNC
jgi:hypothetical protein